MDIQQLTIVPEDSLVIVNGGGIKISMDLPGVHAVQWGQQYKHIEYSDGRHEVLESIAPYQSLIDEHQRLADEADTPLTEKELYEELVRERGRRLVKSDWLILRHLEQPQILKSAQYKTACSYRQALRGLPQKYKSSDEWEWPPAPGFLNDNGNTPSSKPSGAFSG